MKTSGECAKKVKPPYERMKKDEVLYGPIKVGELKELIERGVGINEIMDIIKQKQTATNWLIVFSYDATDEFKANFKKENNRDFLEKELWKVIEDLPCVEGVEKPVKSTMLLEVHNVDDYKEVERIINKQFEGLYYVIGTLAKVEGEEQYDVSPNPESESDNF